MTEFAEETRDATKAEHGRADLLSDNDDELKKDIIEWFDSRDEKAQATAFDAGAAGLASRVSSDIVTGLSAENRVRNQEIFGHNIIETKKSKAYCMLVWEALHDFTVIMLCISAFISLVLGIFVDHDDSEGPPAWIEGCAIIVSVLIVTQVQAGTDYMKELQFKRLSLTVSNIELTVLNNGDTMKIPVRDLAVGDVVEFSTGDMLPADGVISQGSDVKIDESSLTGEPKLISKGKGDLFLLSGTKVMEGNGRMLVLAVGEHSVGGRIRKAVYGQDDEEEENTVLFNKLDKMALLIGKAGTVVAAICFFAMLIIWSIEEFGVADRGFNGKKDGLKIINFFIVDVTVLVVAVPEGLPLAVTLSLSFSVSRMQDDNNLVKHIASCETMGSVTKICTDKTGTLTTNKMTVRRAYIGGTTHKAEEGKGAGVVAKEALSPTLTTLLGEAVALNTMAASRLVKNEATGVTEQEGNKTECSLLGFCADLGIDVGAVRSAPQNQPANDDLPWGERQFAFSSARKMMSWAVKHPSGNDGYRVFCKGASESLLERCDNIVGPDGASVEPLSAEKKQEITNTVIDVLAGEAMRTICIAYKDVPAGADLGEEAGGGGGDANCTVFAVEQGLTMIAIVGIEDPIRDAVPGAIAACRRAAVDVVMCTGDNLETAIAISRNAGILKPEHFHVDKNGKSVPKPGYAMTGIAFRKHVEVQPDGTFSQEKFDEVWPLLRVMARCSPTDKLTLCSGLNKSMLYTDLDKVAMYKREHDVSIFPDRQVIAMTGDGTNDAPALKKADVGFAMGIEGTKIAQDACDIVLMDDNFASIVTACKWGRNIYDSIQKFLQFQVTVNVAACCIVMIGSVSLKETPIAAVQMLWVNLIMDALASLALATERPADTVLDRPPYRRSQSLIGENLAWFIGGHSAYQLIVLLVMLFGADQFGVANGRGAGKPTIHYTLLFNCFVCMTLCNQLNARKLNCENNVFTGIGENKLFLILFAMEAAGQVLIVQFGGAAFKCVPLNGEQWGFCILLGLSVLPWQLVVNATHAWWVQRAAAAPNGPPKFGGGKVAAASSSVEEAPAVEVHGDASDDSTPRVE